MKPVMRLAAATAAVLGLAAWGGATAAGAAGNPGGSHAGAGADHVVFVQTDDPSGNAIVAYDRADDGTLTPSGTYPTGGAGGVVNGSVVDHLASQGALTYDAANALLYAVNAGSNSIAVFAVSGDQLTLRQVVDSGGTFPVSVAASGQFVYVLNALDGGTVAGFRVAGGVLHPIEGSIRPLGLTTPIDASQFTHTPGQIGFSPDGSQVVVTTKASTNAIDVFAVRPDGRLSDAPVVNSEPGTVPFAFVFDSAGHLAVSNAGPSSVSTFTLRSDGTVTLLATAATGQAATCWIAEAQGYLYASNAGSGTVSGYLTAPNGTLTSLGTTATDAGTVDAAATGNGAFLYVQTGAHGIVDEYRVEANGSLISLGAVTVPGSAGGEGIVAA
jgi:6-phosphogluconolactonase (cycloisomerase 2 family)